MRTTSQRGYTDLMRYALGISRNHTKYGALSAKMVQKYITEKKGSGFLLPKTMLMHVAQPAEACVLCVLRPQRAVLQSKAKSELIKAKHVRCIKIRACGLKQM